MKEEDVVKKGAKDVEVNKKKSSNNSKKPSNDVKSKASSTTKKASDSKESTSKDVADKKTTAKKTTAKAADTKKASEKKTTKTSNTKTIKIDSLEEIFESSEKLEKKENKNSSKPLAATKTAVKAGSSKTDSTAKTKSGTTTKSSTTKKEGTAKKISNQVTASEKSSKIKINSKDKTTATIKTKTTKKEDNKKIEKDDKETKNKKTEKDEIIEEVKAQGNEPEEIDLDVIGKELQSKTTIPDADFKKLIKDSALSIIYFIGVLIFLVFDLIMFGKIANSAFIVIQNVFSFVLLGAAIAFFEIAYRKDDTSKCIIGIEALFIGIYTLTIPYICQIFKGTFKNFLLSALVVIVGYYIIKACVVFYKKQNRYLRLQENFTVEEDDNEFNLDDEDDE